MLRSVVTVCALLVSIVAFAPAAARAADAGWPGWSFLLGEWTGSGNGAPGSGTGGFSFRPDLQGRVLVRRSFAAYPASAGRPAYRHDDLTVVYRDPAGAGTRALYTDNEGHAIDYRVEVAADSSRVTFTSVPAPGAPRFRLTYTALAPDSAGLRFETAPPGEPDSLRTYIEATARRTAR